VASFLFNSAFILYRISIWLYFINIIFGQPLKSALRFLFIFWFILCSKFFEMGGIGWRFADADKNTRVLSAAPFGFLPQQHSRHKQTTATTKRATTAFHGGAMMCFYFCIFFFLISLTQKLPYWSWSWNWRLSLAAIFGSGTETETGFGPGLHLPVSDSNLIAPINLPGSEAKITKWSAAKTSQRWWMSMSMWMWMWMGMSRLRANMAHSVYKG